METTYIFDRDDVVFARLVAPELPVNHIRRPSLFAQFLKILPKKITYIASPIGFGKTTLLSEWYQLLSERDSEYYTGWLTFDEKNDDPVYLCKQIVATLGSALPHLKESFPLPVVLDASEEGDIMSYLIRLSNFLHAQEYSGKKVILFFDNYDTVSEELLVSIIHVFINYFPPNFYSVGAGSFFPSAVMDYQHVHAVYGFPVGDLALNKKELALYITSRYEEPASEQFINALYEATEGWIMGIHLFLNAKKPHGPQKLESFDRKLLDNVTEKYFSAYLAKELDEDTLQFLICSSILEKLHISLCDYTLETRESERILVDLTEKSFFISSCVDKTGWFVCHPLFLQWLRSRLFQMRASEIRELSSRAHDWYELHNMPNEAARHMLMASDPDLLRSFAEAARLGRSEVEKPFLPWVCDKKAEEFERSASLSLHASLGYITFGRVADILHWLAAFEKNLKREDLDQKSTIQPEDSEDIDTIVRIIKIKCREFNGYYQECINEYQNLLKEKPTLSLSLRSLVLHAIAESYERKGEYGIALEYYLQSEAVAGLVNSSFFVAFSRFAISWILVYRGELQNAEVACARALEDCPSDYTLYGALQAVLAFIQIEGNNLVEAKTNLEKAMGNLSSNRNADMLIEAQTISACYIAAMGDIEEAYRKIVQIVLVAENADLPRAVLLFAYVIKAKLALQRNCLNDAVATHNRLQACVDSGDSYYRLRTKQIEAVLLHSEKNSKQAMVVIQKVLDEAEDASYNTITVESLLLKVTLLLEDNNKGDALLAFNKAIAIGKNLGLIRPFLDYAPLLRDLFHEVMSIRRIDASRHAYLKRILKAIKTTADNESPLSDAPDAVQRLTAREREVLDLLNFGMSRQEMAETLTVSHNTIKTHLNNIYSKLGVKNRSEVFKLTQEKIHRE